MGNQQAAAAKSIKNKYIFPGVRVPVLGDNLPGTGPGTGKLKNAGIPANREPGRDPGRSLITGHQTDDLTLDSHTLAPPSLQLTV